MRVLIIKTSSMGDLIHTLPALSDAGAVHPDIRFDWVVEEQYAEIPAWHPRVERVIPVALRRWRRYFYRLDQLHKEWRQFRAALQESTYDCIIDAQGLLKSAILATRARGLRYGMDRRSARERIAARFYHYPLAIDRRQHAIDRLRLLFSRVLRYPLPNTPEEYGITLPDLADGDDAPPYLVFVHGTAQRRKEWPQEHWQALCARATAAGCQVRLPWHGVREQQSARALALQGPGITVLPPLNLTALAGVLQGAQAVVTLDTGPGHLAAALGRPVVALYGATCPQRTGTRGQAPQQHLHPAMPGQGPAGISTAQVWEALQAQLSGC